MTQLFSKYAGIDESFAITLTHIDKIACRYEQMEVNVKHMKVVPWPGDVDVKVQTNLLKGIDPGFSIDIRTWGQFKSNIPIIYECFQNHVLFHDYLTEIVICDKANCNICRAFGVGLRTSMTNDGRLRDVLLRPMDCLVNDTNRVGHFVVPKKTRAWIAEKKMTIFQLKDVLPRRDNNPYAAANDKAD